MPDGPAGRRKPENPESQSAPVAGMEYHGAVASVRGDDWVSGQILALARRRDTVGICRFIVADVLHGCGSITVVYPVTRPESVLSRLMARPIHESAEHLES